MMPDTGEDTAGQLAPAHGWLGRVRATLRDDWRGPRYYPYLALALLISAMVTAAYYLNHPQPEIFPDTGTYRSMTHEMYRYVAIRKIGAHGWIVDAHRMPGFPMLMAIVFAIAGMNNNAAVSLVHAGLFLLAVLEIYACAYLVLGRASWACGIAVLVGANVALLSFVKPVLSEALSLWLITSLCLALMWCITRLRAWCVWAVTALLILLLLTRSEWSYAALPVLAYVFVIAARRGRARALLPHLVAGMLLCYGVVGGYIYVNAVNNDYAGISDIQNVNLLGKVMQYHMQDAAPPQYAPITHELDAFIAAGGTNPKIFIDEHADLSAHHYALAGAYATAAIERNPLTFGVDTGLVTVTSLQVYYTESHISATGVFAKPLFALQRIYRTLYQGYLFFLPCAGLWAALFLWRRTSRSMTVELMGGVVLLALYDLVLTSAGGFDSYARFHAPFAPLMMLVICGSLVLALGDGIPFMWRHAVTRGLVARAKRVPPAADEVGIEDATNGIHEDGEGQWRDWSARGQDTPGREAEAAAQDSGEEDRRSGGT